MRDCSSVNRFLVLSLCCCALSVWAAGPGSAAASLEKQRQSVLRQTGGAKPSNSYFTTPWLSEPRPTAAQPAVEANCDPLPEVQLRDLVAAAAREHGVSPQLIHAVIRRESGGRPCAVSPKGAQGLMQLMPATQQTLNVADAFDPAASIGGGTRYLADLLKRYKGDLRRTLAAYNAGPQRVEPDGDLPDIAETKAYVTAIMADIESRQYPDP